MESRQVSHRRWFHFRGQNRYRLSIFSGFYKLETEFILFSLRGTSAKDIARVRFWQELDILVAFVTVADPSRPHCSLSEIYGRASRESPVLLRSFQKGRAKILTGIWRTTAEQIWTDSLRAGNKSEGVGGDSIGHFFWHNNSIVNTKPCGFLPFFWHRDNYRWAREWGWKEDRNPSRDLSRFYVFCVCASVCVKN